MAYVKYLIDVTDILPNYPNGLGVGLLVICLPVGNSCYNKGESVKCGDEIVRTTPTGLERALLPPIDLQHLLPVTVSAKSRADGFHVLPARVVRIGSAGKIVLPQGAVDVLDASGNPFVGAVVVVLPHRIPVSEFDAFEARVEVYDGNGAILAVNSSKSFFPQGWTEEQIQEAIYTARAQE